MSDSITVVVDQEPIKFTPDGKVDVLDALTALCAGQDSAALWDRLLTQHPEFSRLCESYPFARQRPAIVTDAKGWEVIQAALFDYFLETY